MSSPSLLLDRPMPKKKPGRPPTERDDIAVKIDRKIGNRLAYIAKARRMPIAELLTEWVRPIVDREFEKVMAEERASSN